MFKSLFKSRKQKMTAGFVLIGFSILLFVYIFYSIFSSAQS